MAWSFWNQPPCSSVPMCLWLCLVTLHTRSPSTPPLLIPVHGSKHLLYLSLWMASFWTEIRVLSQPIRGWITGSLSKKWDHFDILGRISVCNFTTSQIHRLFFWLCWDFWALFGGSFAPKGISVGIQPQDGALRRPPYRSPLLGQCPYSQHSSFPCAVLMVFWLVLREIINND